MLNKSVRSEYKKSNFCLFVCETKRMKRRKELPEGDVSVQTEDLPEFLKIQFPDSSETKCPRCDKMLTKEEIDKHMKNSA